MGGKVSRNFSSSDKGEAVKKVCLKEGKKEAAADDVETKDNIGDSMAYVVRVILNIHT